MLKKSLISFLIIGIACFQAMAQSSVLSSGNWYKIAVSNSGMYKLDYNFFQNTLKIAPATINPQKIKIYGNGGKMLPQKNVDARYSDLEENHIYVFGENDGVFNPNDYVIFYGEGTTTWKLNNDSSRFEHITNIYSDTSYYFINIEGANGKRVLSNPAGTNSAALITTFNDYTLYEKDDFNLIKSGRTWYSDRIDVFPYSKNFSLTLAGYTSNTPFSLTAALMGGSPKENSFTIKQNNQIVGIMNFTKYNAGDEYHSEGQEVVTTYPNLVSSSPSINITLDYTTNGATEAKGYVNYFEINYQRNLTSLGVFMHFRSIASLNQTLTSYQINNATSATNIWNITDPLHPFVQEFNLSGTSAIFTENAPVLQEYITFSTNSFPAPIYVGNVKNQNIRGIELPTLLIVTHPNFKDAAQQLADFRIKNDGMEVSIVEIQEVYNEFSSGKQDITAIRDLAKFIYDKDAGGRFKYLLLFGDCSYDYKNRVGGNTNFVPTYQSYQSLSPTTTYSSDDYFGFLDQNEGEWREFPADQDMLNIGIGRIVCKTPTEASAIVNKIIHYSKNQDIFGKWKNEVTLIADDGDNNSHLGSAEVHAKFIEDNYQSYNVNKIYIDAYEQIPTATGQRAPQVNDAFNRKIESGSFITNYTGHGGELGLAHERILTNDMINAWENFDRLTLMFTATCEFGRYDDPERVSAGEYTLLNPKGGAVAIITTSRPVYSGSNQKINTAFFSNVFEPMPDGTMPRLGDLMIKTKNASISGINNRNFTLLGDPSMRLAYPKDNIVLTSFNDSTITLNSDTLKALSKVTLKGEIRNNLDQKITNFKGNLDVRVFDKKASLTTLGDGGALPRTFTLFKDIIFNGKASVENGTFEFTFVVPKDIAYQYGNGKISLYAQTTNLEQNTDASGYNLDLVVGGSNPNALADNEPPIVESFMDDFSFVFGGMTGKNPILLGKLSDENGINTAGSGIGHEITAVLDDNREEIIVLNEYYTSAINDYTKGTVEFPLYNLETGHHNLRLKAWDVYNNSGEDYLEFTVVDGEGIQLAHLLNYPNPFSTKTYFHFDHSRSGDDLDVKIQIFTLTGKMVRTFVFDVMMSPSHIESPEYFDGKDEFGDQLAKGVYIYKVSVRSKTDGKQVNEYEKLLLLK